MIINFAQRVTHDITLTQPDGPRDAQRKNMQEPHLDHLKKILSYMTNMMSYIVLTQKFICFTYLELCWQKTCTLCLSFSSRPRPRHTSVLLFLFIHILMDRDL